MTTNPTKREIYFINFSFCFDIAGLLYQLVKCSMGGGQGRNQVSRILSLARSYRPADALCLPVYRVTRKTNIN